ncbi:glycosyl transferase group 1 [Gloeocapsa sp. PCC 7428]|uniref:glycosyltransferase n=1 Tax=Gloeocapsa sp. PCC 7428 TaxID=1173026 RepID=UPI0002A61EB2|nr:glycosyltransferase [Gloeocapsa sp. PCC 7428]AFZ32836.1 glycosyl transferase group 1 [Gloeocapsa sp. PCC 7428]
MDTQRISFFLPALYGGGAERVTINLLKGFVQRGVLCDLVLASAEGPYLDQVPPQVRIVNLNAGRVVKAILPLSNYLRREKPKALVSHLNHANVIAILAKKLVRTKTRLIVVEHNTLSADRSKLWRGKLVPPLMKLFYPQADAVIGVSQGVVHDLETYLKLESGKISVIYNPVIDDVLLAQATASLEHPWFQKDTLPVFLAVGRLSEQKDFLTLIQAFALLRRNKHARLVILGEGEERSKLEDAIASLGISQDVALPGFVANPYAYMSRASAFVLSSRWEGLPTVLIEAMACGCPVIATDCPSGTREILDAGVYGKLVPVGDVGAMAWAMQQIIDTSTDQDRLIQRAMCFTIDRVVPKYLTLLNLP